MNSERKRHQKTSKSDQNTGCRSKHITYSILSYLTYYRFLFICFPRLHLPMCPIRAFIILIGLLGGQHLYFWQKISKLLVFISCRDISIDTLYKKETHKR